MEYKTSRREFIKLTTATVAGAMIIPSIIPSTALGMGGKLPPSERIVMGAIGVGSQGTGNMKRFLKISNVQFVALCDVDSSHLAKGKEIVDKSYLNSDCRIYGDYREFLLKEKIDAVSIVEKTVKLTTHFQFKLTTSFGAN